MPERNYGDQSVDIDGSGEHVNRAVLDGITAEWRKTTNALRDTERRYRDLVDNASDMIYRTDPFGRFTFVNPVATRILGFDEGELLSMKYFELIRPDWVPRAMSFYEKAAKTRESTYLEFPVRKKDGQEIWVVGTILDDKTVRGGTGWGAEFAKLCNKKLHVFDQEKKSWFWWTGEDWHAPDDQNAPRIMHHHFTGTGTRTLGEPAKKAIADLFARSF